MIAKPDAATCTWAEMGEWLHQRCMADTTPGRHRWTPAMLAGEKHDRAELARLDGTGPTEQPETDDRLLRALNEQAASLRKTVGQLEMEVRALKVRISSPPPARPTTPPVTRPAPTKPKTLLDSYDR